MEENRDIEDTGKGRKRKVLLVDDEEDMLAFLTSFIEGPDTEIFHAKDPQNALEIFKQHKPDIVFLDFHLSGVKGIDVLTILRKISPDPKVFFVTGDRDLPQKYPAKDIGVEGYILKPILPSQIKDIIDKLDI